MTVAQIAILAAGCFLAGYIILKIANTLGKPPEGQ